MSSVDAVSRAVYSLPGWRHVVIIVVVLAESVETLTFILRSLIACQLFVVVPTPAEEADTDEQAEEAIPSDARVDRCESINTSHSQQAHESESDSLGDGKDDGV